MRGGYRGIDFVTTGTLLGQQIDLKNKTDDAVTARRNIEKGACGIIKYRVFQDREIKMGNELDLWNAEIGSVLKYGLATIRITEETGREIQQFSSKCTDEILYPKIQTEVQNMQIETQTKKTEQSIYNPPIAHNYKKPNLRHI